MDVPTVSLRYLRRLGTSTPDVVWARCIQSPSATSPAGGL